MSPVKDFYNCAPEDDTENSLSATIRKQGFSDNMSAYQKTLRQAKVNSADYAVCRDATQHFLNSIFEKNLPVHMTEALETASHYTDLLRQKIDNQKDIAHLPSKEIQEIEDAALGMQLLVKIFKYETHNTEKNLPAHFFPNQFNPAMN